MEIHYGTPFRGEVLENLRCFLLEQDLIFDEQARFSVCIMEGSKIAAAGSLDVNVLKCIAVAPAYRNEGLAARIVTELINEAARQGQHHLFIFTKPDNRELFSGLGFYAIAETEGVLLMENIKDGIACFVSGLKTRSLQIQSSCCNRPFTSGHAGEKKIGAIVANCNPFTKGHLYLIETAASRCDVVNLFILSENKSEFSAELRRELVVRCTAHIPNVIVQPTGPYLISGATFPEYFLRGNSPQNVNGELDLKIFAECFARPLNIRRRFVGTEPNCPVTAAYNEQMKEILPRYGIEVVEIPRLEIPDRDSGDLKAVSASQVRFLMKEGKKADIKTLVPPFVYQYLSKNDK